MVWLLHGFLLFNFYWTIVTHFYLMCMTHFFIYICFSTPHIAYPSSFFMYMTVAFVI